MNRMCMALYVGSEHPLPLLPWCEGESRLCVQELRGYEAMVRQRFSKPHVAYLGAWTGCSCGFNYGLGGEIAEGEDQLGRESVDQLRLFLEQRLLEAEEIELLAFREGDADEDLEQELVVTPAHFAGDQFALQERVRYLVRRET